MEVRFKIIYEYEKNAKRFFRIRNKDKYSKMIYSPAFKRIKNVRSNKYFQYHNY